MSTQTYKYLNKLANKRVLIIGGSSGLGFAVAEASIENGASVILASSNPTKLASAANRLKSTYASLISSNSTISTLTIDLSDTKNLRPSLTSLLDQATSDGQLKIDHVIYTADAASPLPPFHETQPKDISASFSMRAYAPIILASLLKGSDKYIAHSPDTSITFTNGSSSHRPMPGWAVADTAAGAMEGLVRGLTCDLAPVRVNLVSSGPVTTELFQTLPKEAIELFRSKCLTGRLGRPEDVAEAYLYHWRYYLYRRWTDSSSVVDKDRSGTVVHWNHVILANIDLQPILGWARGILSTSPFLKSNRYGCLRLAAVSHLQPIAQA